MICVSVCRYGLRWVDAFGDVCPSPRRQHVFGVHPVARIVGNTEVLRCAFLCEVFVWDAC
jgi:hypothetical protein